MIIPSIFVFLTLIYREVGKYIIHPVPVIWKKNIDIRYLKLCEKVKLNRLTRNSALEATFRLILIFGFILAISISAVAGRNDFLLEVVIFICLFLNLNFSFQDRKHIIKEHMTALLLMAGLSVLGIVFMEFGLLENNAMRIIKSWIGLIFGDLAYKKITTFVLYCVSLIVTAAIFGLVFRFSAGIINEIVYYLLSLVIRFSEFLGKENAFSVLLFMITSCSYIMNEIWKYNQS